MNIQSFARSASFALLLAIPAFGGIASAHEDTTQYPVPAAEFQAKVDARMEKMKARIEERIVDKKIPADKAAEMRARFEAKTQTLKAEVAKVTADGVVTADEAKEVRQAAGHGHGHCEGHHENQSAPTQ